MTDSDVLAARGVFGPSFDVAARYVAALAGRGVEWGLVGPREVPRLWERHVLNSVAVAELIGAGKTVVDAGSGAGLPGIPLAILRPDLKIVLVESMLRRVTFLSEVVGELRLSERVSVWRGRIENYPSHADVVTCRAVAPLDRLLGWTMDVFLPDGELLALKGSSVRDEVAAAGPVLRRARLSAEVIERRLSPDVEPTMVVRVARATR